MFICSSIVNKIHCVEWLSVVSLLELRLLYLYASLRLEWTESSLQWRHNGLDNVSNHQPRDCLLNRLFRRRSKKTSKLRVTGLCAGNSPGTGEFPAQMASYAENVAIWWRHHDNNNSAWTYQVLSCTPIASNWKIHHWWKPNLTLFHLHKSQHHIYNWFTQYGYS